jgi:tetratricopeptide (TPR) repeat protein
VDPNGARALTGEALSLLLQNRIDAALDAANRAVKAQPNFAAAHAVKGCALLKNGNRLAAAGEFKQAANDTRGATCPSGVAAAGDGAARLQAGSLNDERRRTKEAIRD